MTNPKQNYYYIIPAKLAESGDLTKAMLYGLVSSLCNEDGYCWASNKYLGQKLGRKNIGNISLKLNELVKDGYLDIKQEKKGNDRKIYLSAEATLTKKRKGASEKPEGYPYEKPEDSNISLSNKVSNLPAQPAEMGPVEQMFEVFYRTVNPNINFGNKTSRAAAEFLIKKHGLEKAVGAATFAVQCQNQKYAPTITTPYQLKEKMAALIKFKLSHQQNQGIKIAQ